MSDTPCQRKLDLIQKIMEKDDKTWSLDFAKRYKQLVSLVYNIQSVLDETYDSSHKTPSTDTPEQRPEEEIE